MSTRKTAPTGQGATGEDPGRSAPSSGGSPSGGEASGDDGPGESPGFSLASLFRRPTTTAADGARTATKGAGNALSGGSPAERLMIGNIMRLHDLQVVDVMIPRADIAAVSDRAGLNDAMAAFERGGLSRLPVFRETLDNPVGFIHLKDLALQYGVGRRKNGKGFSLSRHLHQALFVPPSMGIVPLLQKMQGERVHMALVIDEFGGVDGLVTIEDLLEQIVGEIEDEHDTPDRMWRVEAPGVWTINARADIEEFEAAAGLHLRPKDWDEEADTLGGLVFALLGRVPARGEVVPHPMGHEFQILDADPRRIKRLRLTTNGAGAGDAAK